MAAAPADAIQETRAHGTRARYVFGVGPGVGEGCRCDACVTANRQDAARRARLRAYGQWQPYVDAGPARDHLAALSRAGIGWKRAAELAGLSTGTVSKLLFGKGGRLPSRRIRPETAEAILAVHVAPASLGQGALVPADGTRRRLQALVAIGWSQARLADRLGMTPSNFGSALGRDRVTAATARTVERLYDDLWNRPPPEPDQHSRISASRARNYARARGWAPPLAWDDDEMDDPDARPADGWQRTGRDTRRCRPAAEVAEDVADLERLGDSREHIAMRLGTDRKSLERALYRAAEFRAREPELIAEAG
jgi:transcriptional regulator with XRE-family HTH domain